MIPTKAYAYLDKNKSLGHLDTKICKTKIMKFFLENIAQFISKEGPDINNFTKNFAHILNYEFYRQ